MLAGERLEQRDEFSRRQHAASVEMIDRRQRLRRDRRVRTIGLAQCFEDALGDAPDGVTASAVMMRDRIRRLHVASRSWIWRSGMLRQLWGKTQRGSEAMPKIERMQPEGMN